MSEDLKVARPGLKQAVIRGLKWRCPNCGEGKLFKSYLRQVDSCAVCGEHFEHIRTDDAAPWLTILVTGHLVVPTAIAVHTKLHWPDWLGMIVWPGVAIALAFIILPFAKAVFLSAIWAMKTPGSERL